MPADGNGDWLPKPALLGLWFYTGCIVLAMLYLALFNPGNTFGESQVIILGWLQKYPGQSTALQLLGTFVVTMGIMPYLLERRLIGSLPIVVRITALAGASVTMAGLVIQDIPDSYLAPIVLGALAVSVVPVWILAAAWPRLKRVYSWLKSRRKPGS